MRKLSVLLILVLLVSMVAGVSAAPQPPMMAKGPVQGSAARLPVPLTPGTLWANGSYDDINGLASELNTAVSDARTADDFELATSSQITQIRASHMTSSNPYNAQVELYQDSGGNGPGTQIGPAIPMFSAALIGYSQYGWPIVEYTYNTPPDFPCLPAGHYWLSSIGLGDGTFADRSFFATSGYGQVQLQEGYFLSNYFGFTTWTPTSAVYGYSSDYAFDIDGTACPPPGTPADIFKDQMKWAPAAKPNRWKVSFNAVIMDNQTPPQPAGGTTVYGTWTYPDGTPYDVHQGTDSQGRAKFAIKVRLTGDYTFCVTDIQGNGYYWENDLYTAPECRTVTVTQ